LDSGFMPVDHLSITTIMYGVKNKASRSQR